MPAISEAVGDWRANAADALLGVESKTPGHNTFAARQIKKHRVRLQSNAFYQKKFLESKGLPPDTEHPAFRDPRLLSDLSIPMPKMAPPPTRDSTTTTMTPFIEAGQQRSPPLYLNTTPRTTPQPTQRAFIEDRREAELYEASGRIGERVPVFRPTPVLNQGEFKNDQCPAGKHAEVRFMQTQPLKSPKKTSYLARLFGGARRGAQPPTGPFTTDNIEEHPRMPPKAEQILGKSPIKGILRTPSKSKKLFSRRQSDTDILSSPTRSRSNAGSTRPRTAMGAYNSKPTTPHASVSGSRSSHTRTHSTPTLPRSQSLKYIDSAIPPTPPSKDTPPGGTPPDERVVRDAYKHRDPIKPFDSTPTKTSGFLSTRRSLSPAKSGNHAQRVSPRLVTQQSVHSMRASVGVEPAAMNPTEFEDAKTVGRVAGLGLKGFNFPGEYNQPPPDPVYSPSVYSPDNSCHSVSTFGGLPESVEEVNEAESSPTPQMAFRQSTRSQDSSSSTGTIKIDLHPDLLKDKSITDFMNPHGSLESYQAPAPDQEWHDDDHPSREQLDEILSTVPQYAPSDSSNNNLVVPPEHPSAQVSPLHLHSSTMEALPPNTFDTPSAHRGNYKNMFDNKPSLTLEASPSYDWNLKGLNVGPPKSSGRHPVNDLLLGGDQAEMEEEEGYLLKHIQRSSGEYTRKQLPLRAVAAPRARATTKNAESNNMIRQTSAKESYAPDSAVELSDQETVIDESGIRRKGKKDGKRISTTTAQDFYRVSPEPQQQPRIAPSTRVSEDSTIILTSNLPHGSLPRGVVYDPPPAEEIAHYSSLPLSRLPAQALRQEKIRVAPRTANATANAVNTTAGARVPRAATPTNSSAPKSSDAENVRRLENLVAKQEAMMQKMMLQMQKMQQSMSSSAQMQQMVAQIMELNQSHVQQGQAVTATNTASSDSGKSTESENDDANTSA